VAYLINHQYIPPVSADAFYHPAADVLLRQHAHL
jgi:hypothetical protein